VGHLAKQKYERMPLALNVIRKKKFCVLQKKVLSFGPNRIVEVRPNSWAEPNVQSVTIKKKYPTGISQPYALPTRKPSCHQNSSRLLNIKGMLIELE
jgi:hypothetical protein